MKCTNFGGGFVVAVFVMLFVELKKSGVGAVGAEVDSGGNIHFILFADDYCSGVSAGFAAARAVAFDGDSVVDVTVFGDLEFNGRGPFDNCVGGGAR